MGNIEFFKPHLSLPCPPGKGQVKLLDQNRFLDHLRYLP